MAENNASDVRLNTNSNGMVYFASDVVATIAGLAVTEVEGVANTVGTSGGLTEIFMRRALSNSRNLTRGIKVEITDNVVSVDVTIVVEYGFPVPEVAQGIQENVKKAIETMTGMSVKSVDVHVTGVSFERENRAVAELEMNQRKLLGKEAPARRTRSLRTRRLKRARKKRPRTTAISNSIWRTLRTTRKRKGKNRRTAV